MAITYVGTTITVTGYTEGTPCNFTDIYNADVSGGWGVVTRQCTNQFCFTCKILQIGDGSTATWFADTQKMVYFNFPLPQSGNKFLVKANAHATFGTLDANSFGKDGCSFLFHNEEEIKNDGEYNLYGCSLSSLPSVNYCSTWIAAGTTTRFYDVTVCNLYCPIRIGGAPTVFEVNRMSIIKPDLGIRATSDASYNDMYIFDPGRANVFTQDGAVLTATDCDFPQDPTYSMWVFTGGGTINLVNPAQSLYTHYFTANGYIYYKYTFDLVVVDSVGTGIDTAKVKIWDKDDSLVTNTSTNSSGILATQTLIDKYYTNAGGVVKTPHELRIYKYGVEMLSSKSSIEKKADWALTMYTDPHITQTTEATVAAYTGITINHTAETITISSNHTLDEIYDYCQYDIIASTKQLDQTMHTSDGVNFVSEYSFAVVSGITVTATDQKLSMVSGETYTLIGSAQFTGIIATTTTTRIPIKLTNIIDGSRYWVGKQSDGTKIFEGTQSGSGTVTGYYEHTANIDIDIRTRKSSASVKYKPWIGEGTLIAEAFSLRIRQIQDSIVT